MRKSTKLRFAAAGVGVAALALLAGPALAASTTIADSNGNDFDPAALVSDPVSGAPIVSLNDGSSESTDILSASLTTGTQSWNGGAAEGTLTATITIDGTIPADGASSVGNTDWDGPSPNFVGGGYKVLFSNTDKETNGDNTHSGCARLDGGRVRDQSGHWKDGYRYFVGLEIANTGATWQWTPEVGLYDPSPDGGFVFTDLSTEPAEAGRYTVTKTTSGSDTVLTITVAGLVKAADNLCIGGAHSTDYYAAAVDGRPGHYAAAGDDHIKDVFALSTANQVVTLPVALPTGAVLGDDIQSVGGLVYFSDTTTKNGSSQSVYVPGLIGVTDTLGDGPTCPTSTFGGTLPNNPLWEANQNQPCQIDDDAVVAATGEYLLTEWLPSGYNPA